MSAKKKPLMVSDADELVLRQALAGAIGWEMSVSDAHYGSIDPWNRTAENNRIAARSEAQIKRYRRLLTKLNKNKREGE